MPLLTVGHRGLMDAEPENTLRSFRFAERAGVDVIELDLHLSKDGALVVMHDATVDRTTDGSGLVGDLTVAELRELDAGLGERVPLFEEVIAAVTLPVQAEIKDRAAARLLTEVIAERGLHDRVRAISFHEEALAEVRRRLPGLPLALVTDERTPEAPERARSLGASMISAEFPGLTAEVVDRAHATGIEVISWTVNTPAQLDRALALGLDGVVTDTPAMVRAAQAPRL